MYLLDLHDDAVIRMLEIHPVASGLAVEHEWNYVNPVLCQMFGVSAENLVGHDTAEMIAPEERDLYIKERAALERDGGRRTTYWTAIRPDGLRLALQYTLKLVTVGDVVVRMIVLIPQVRDDTQLDGINSQLRQITDGMLDINAMTSVTRDSIFVEHEQTADLRKTLTDLAVLFEDGAAVLAGPGSAEEKVRSIGETFRSVAALLKWT